MQTHPNYIDGKWTVSAEHSANVNPSDVTDVVGHYSRASEDDVLAAIQSAARAKPHWGRALPTERATVLDRVAAELTQRSGELGELLAREEGKTRREAHAEVLRAAQTFSYYAHSLRLSTGSQYPSQRPNTTIFTRRRPVGVVAVISPWNFPLAVPAWKIAPALAHGNSVIFKPAEVVSASAWALTDIIVRAGADNGEFQLVMGSGRTIGNTLVGHPLIDAITFTGSTAVGSKLLADAHSRSNIRVQTEMGGKNGIVILDDADIDIALDAVMDSAFGSTGQRCTASSRIIVTPGIHDQLVDGLMKRMRDLTVGHALADNTQMGPVAHRAQFESDLEYIDIGTSEGATLLAGGSPAASDTDGHFLQPTLFGDGTSRMRINQEEIFGPVACIIEEQDLDEAIDTLNDTPFGLSAGLITSSLASAEHFHSTADAGLITINASPAISELHAPFGGMKESGYGPREQGDTAHEFFTQQTTHFVTSG